MFRVAVMLLVAGLVGSASGCRGKDSLPGVEGTNTRTNGSDDSVLWPFWPTRMAIHPATRLTIDTGSGVKHFEARIAFYDQFGDICKAVGEMRLELEDPCGMKAIMPEWTIDLRDLRLNGRHYDDVTRTYLFKLKIENDWMPAKAILHVYFLSDDGTEFEIDEAVQLR